MFVEYKRNPKNVELMNLYENTKILKLIYWIAQLKHDASLPYQPTYVWDIGKKIRLAYNEEMRVIAGFSLDSEGKIIPPTCFIFELRDGSIRTGFTNTNHKKKIIKYRFKDQIKTIVSMDPNFWVARDETVRWDFNEI